MEASVMAKRVRDDCDGISDSPPLKQAKKTLKELAHDAYTVGWVCVLQTELNAARAMLDEEHKRLPQLEKDDNSYILGRMGQHNVVLTFTGAGSYGKSAATQATTHMVRTFRNIKFGLLVGVGGGAPKPPHSTDPLKDIRLGDVVVGSARGRHGGVLHSDMGKWKGDGDFHIDSHLNKTPKILSKAIELLQSDLDFEQGEMQEYILQATKRGPLRSATFPGRDKDKLYSSDCEHLGKEDCSTCDVTLAEERLDRDSDDPAIHYGLIASGDAVMRSAKLRDKLRDAHDVTCFEMEAAGVVDDFPCAVIRGICDYSDEHKSKLWQPYSALVAAAYAKDLLRVIQPQEVQTMKAVTNLLESVDQQLKAIRTTSETDEILQWLTPIDYGLQQSHAIRIRTPGTGQWLLDSTHYKTWLAPKGGMLFCPGIPGAGKTILTSAVINDLTDRFQGDETIGIAYAYYNYQRQEEQTAEHLLASLLKQLIPKCTAPAELIGPLYQRHMEKKTRPTLNELLETSQPVFFSYQQVFIVLDALDEIQPDESGRARVLSVIMQLQSLCEINIFATSRYLPDIMKLFQADQTREIRATTEDIQTYINTHTNEMSTVIRHDQALQAAIAVGISEAVDGMFLLAKIYLDSLGDKTSTKAVKNAFMQFRKQAQGSSESQRREVLDLAYKDVMERINQQQPGLRQHAIKVLSWVFCAKRPLRTLELQHALAVEIDSTEFDQENLTTIDITMQVCAGLVTINKASDIIELAHYTTQEYLERTQTEWFPKTRNDITATCLSYLSLEIFDDGVCQSILALDDRLRSYPFYDYAAANWGTHAREAGLEVKDSVLRFFHKRNHVFASSQALMNSAVLGVRVDREMWPMDAIHLAAYFGLSDIVADLTRHPRFAWSKYTKGRTALVWAAARGHADVVRLLLANPHIDINSVDGSGETALSAAVENGHELVVRLLIENGRGADVNASSIDDDCPIYIAVQEHQTAIIDLLLTRSDLDANAKGESGLTSLHWAVKFEHEATVQVLLKNKSVDPNMKDREGMTPLMTAIKTGCPAIMTMLLGREDINMFCRTPTGQTLFQLAAECSNQMFVRLYLAKLGIDADSTDTKDGRTAISYALDFTRLDSWNVWAEMASASRGYPLLIRVLLVMTDSSWRWKREGPPSPINQSQGNDIGQEVKDQPGLPSLVWATASGDELAVQSLLGGGVDLEIKSSAGLTPLLIAVCRNAGGIVQQLLNRGADTRVRDSDGRTPLSVAIHNGCEAIVRQLLDVGADSEQGLSIENTPLFAAISSRNERIIKLLLDRGADIQGSKYFPQTTPLLHAVWTKDERVVQLLIENGADVNSPGFSDPGRTPLWLAAFNEFGNIVQLLLEGGADIESGSSSGKTPLGVVVTSGKVEMVRQLLQMGARVVGNERCAAFVPKQSAIWIQDLLNYYRLKQIT